MAWQTSSGYRWALAWWIALTCWSIAPGKAAAQAEQADLEGIARLVKGIQDPNPTTRLATLSLLGDRAEKARAHLSIGVPDRPGYAPPIMEAIRAAGPQVAELTRDPDFAIRRAAVRALGRMHAAGEVAAPAFTAALASDDRYLRAAAVEALGGYLDRQQEINDSPMTIRYNVRLPATERFLADWIVMLRALPETMKRNQPEVVEGTLQAQRGALTTFAKALGIVGEGAKPEETEVLRARVVELIDAYQPWVPLLTADLPQRAPAGQALSAAVVEDLARLCDPRLETAGLFFRIDDPTRPPEDRIKVPDPHPHGRLLKPDLQPEGKKAADALMASLASAVPSLARTLPNVVDPVQRAILEGLEAMGPPAAAAAPAIVRLLPDETRFVRWAGTRCLGRIGPTTDAPLAVEGLVGRLRDSDPDVRLAACQALTTYKAKAAAAVAALGDLVATSEPDVQLGGVQALETIVEAIGGEGQPAVAGLAAGLKSRDYRVRQTAARILGLIGPGARQALPALQGALDDEEIDVRLSAAEAIVKINAR